MVARAVCSETKWASIDRLPRAALAINAPIDDNAIATIDSATSTSISVNPAMLILGAVERYNLNPPCQPIDADLVAGGLAGQGDEAAPRQFPREETDN